MKLKSLSFGDFGDEEKLLGSSSAAETGLGFDSDGDETSDF